MNHQYNKPNNTQSASKLPNIELDYIKNPDLFDKTAKTVAEVIEGGTKTTQIRNFYDYVLELNEKANHQPFNEIMPFVKMLNSKAAYSQSRKLASKEFVEMIEKCVNQVKTKENLNVFKLFFEAVLGFSKNKEKK